MKKQVFLFATIAAMLFCGCQFSTGNHKDLRSGLSFSYNGFRVQDVFLTDSGSTTKRTDNSVAMNTRVDILVKGISGYTPKDGKVLPGMSVTVTDTQGNNILNAEDVLAQINPAPEEDASALQSYVAIGEPMKPGNTYHIKVHVWDKYNLKNTLDANVDIVVKNKNQNNKYGLEYGKQNIENDY
ncbi:MAG: hypothetical protein QM610_07010 [Chitinophagaceae bacterium]